MSLEESNKQATKTSDKDVIFPPQAAINKRVLVASARRFWLTLA